jgi:hypothetical protein
METPAPRPEDLPGEAERDDEKSEQPARDVELDDDRWAIEDGDSE